MRQRTRHIIRNLLLLVVPIAYWFVFFLVSGDLPVGPAVWNLLVLFAFVGPPILVAGICLLQYHFRDKPFSWLTIAGFSFVMICSSLYFVFCFGAAIQYAHGGR
ncbi:hypothetical protein [Schlesneria paludicola]|uniref:hypothetical protein n=1 Tax=Schlesneria paludicola TaxID=360056 RepID=UPI00029A5D97|nr:hypothetical protein [Schlesneria paludicola]